MNVRADNMNVWVITMTGIEGTLFENEKYKLRYGSGLVWSDQ